MVDDPAKVLSDMEFGIGSKISKARDEFDSEFAKLLSSYADMPAEVKAHPMYKPLGSKISSVDALLTTLGTTAALFPSPDVRGCQE